MQVIEVSRKKFVPPTAEQKEEVRKKILKMQKDGEKLRKCLFEFVEAQGGYFDFSYRFFPGEPSRKVKIIHGETIDIPEILMKHLNNCYKKVRVPRKNADLGTKKSDSDHVVRTSRIRCIPVDAL